MLVSIIIPCGSNRSNLDLLLKDISDQELSFEKEIIEIINVSPSGKARNNGAKKAKGEFLIFLDCDVRLGHSAVLNNLVQELILNNKVGICGASQLIPKDANSFQQRLAKYMPNTEHPLVDQDQEVGMVGGGCCAIRKKVFFEIGSFNEKLLRGVDVELCHRIKTNGYKVILLAKTWIYHSPASKIIELLRVSFRNGRCVAFADKYYPELNFDVGKEDTIISLKKKRRRHRLLRYLQNIFVAIGCFRFTLLLAKLLYGLGYVYGFMFNKNPEYNKC